MSLGTSLGVAIIIAAERASYALAQAGGFAKDPVRSNPASRNVFTSARESHMCHSAGRRSGLDLVVLLDAFLSRPEANAAAEQDRDADMMATTGNESLFQGEIAMAATGIGGRLPVCRHCRFRAPVEAGGSARRGPFRPDWPTEPR